MQRTLLCWGLLLFFQGLLPAQSSTVLSRITLEQGLPQGYISGMAQDVDGFMWFGTMDGLCRYDGYTFQVFRHDPQNPFSLSHNAVVGIVPLGDFLAVATYAGVDLLDLHDRRFHRLGRMGGWMASDGRQTLYVTTGDAVFRYVLNAASVANIRQKKPPPLALDTLLTGASWRSTCLNPDVRTLWLLRASGTELCSLDLVTGRLSCFACPKGLVSTSIISDGTGGVWLKGQNLLGHFDPNQANAPWKLIRIEQSRLTELRHYDPIHQVLWLEMDDVCGFRLDLNQLPKSIRPEQALWRLNIPEGLVNSMTDRNGIVWFGTNAHGIRQFNPRSAAFSHYLPGHSVYCKPMLDDNGHIWLGRIIKPGSPDHYNHYLDLHTGKLHLAPLGPDATDMLAGNTIADADGNLWTGGKCRDQQQYKLIRYAPKTGQYEALLLPIEVPYYFDELVLRFEAPSSLWVYLPYQMRRLDTRTRTWTVYDYRQYGDGQQSIVTVALTADGSHWMAQPTGMVQAKPDGKGGFRFSHWQANTSPPHRLPNNNIKCLLTDPDDPHILWIGTGGGGLSRLDTRTNQFAHFTTQNGLPNNVVYGIVPEHPRPPEGQVFWLSTNRGLARFSTQNLHFQYFTSSDGLPNDEFNTHAYGTMPDGRLIFGGVNGLTIFNPKDLSPNAKLPTVRLTALRVNGALVEPLDSTGLLAQGIERTQMLELTHHQNNLVLQFAALDYASPKRNQFRFYLEGAEPEWAHQGFDHTAQYLTLAPGTYTFYVKAANSDGTWNKEPVALRIVIRPPWYAAPWAYALYALLVAAAVYAVYRVQLRRRLAQAEAKRLRELDLVKNRLYTNITHEFRTPLTVILGVTEQVEHTLQAQGLKTQALLLEQVKRNGAQLLQLINQLLDLAKLESGNMTLHLQGGDVVGFLRYVVESFHSYAIGQGLQVHFESGQASLDMDYDPEKLQTVIVNLLSNALKFTPPGGQVFVKLETIAQEGETWLSLQVRDTGPGIAPKKLPFVFDRFYQADDSATRHAGGTGIGLALVRELVLLMGGQVSAANADLGGGGGGAILTVLLPVRRYVPPGIAQPTDQKVWHPPAVAVRPAAVLGPIPETLDDRPVALVVEDHPEVAEYVLSCLRDTYQVLLARDGQAGIEQALERIPDLIVSDVMMPRKDGFELCAALKNDERVSHVPIVLLTAKADVENRIAGLRQGADAYLAKPFHREELRAILANLLAMRRKLQAKYAALGESGISQTTLEKTEPDPEDVFLQKLRTLIEAHLAQPDLSVEAISRMMGMSYTVVHRKVTALTGRSLTLYVRAVRLQKARDLLADPALGIAEVAYGTGFNDPKFFSRVFSEEYGMTPTTFRKSLQG